MGYLAHVCTTYTVKYDEGSLNQLSYEVNRLLLNFSYFNEDVQKKTGVVIWYNCEDAAYSDVLELAPVGLRKLVDELRLGNLDKMVELYLKGTSPASLASIFEKWLNDYDKNNEYIRIEWF